jgi:ribosomal protein L19
LKGVLSGEVGILSGRNTRYCDSGQSRNSVDLLPRVLIANLSSCVHVSMGHRKICQGWGQERSSLKVSEENLKEIEVLRKPGQ